MVAISRLEEATRALKSKSCDCATTSNSIFCFACNPAITCACFIELSKDLEQQLKEANAAIRGAQDYIDNLLLDAGGIGCSVEHCGWYKKHKQAIERGLKDGE